MTVEPTETDGKLEYWNNEKLEKWKIGKLERVDAIDWLIDRLSKCLARLFFVLGWIGKTTFLSSPSLFRKLTNFSRDSFVFTLLSL
jgi:hypothetical protein